MEQPLKTKKWKVVNPTYDDGDNVVGSEILEYSEQDILDCYWAYWSERMKAMFGEGSTLITPERCIEDWVVVNWAWQDD
jgi:hypothetical protein